MIKIRSTGTAMHWDEALKWMNAEFSRFGWCRHSVYEDIDNKVIRGKVSKVIERYENKRARIDKTTTFEFEIRDFDGFDSPSVFMYKFGGKYRVYHEFHFSSDPIFPLWKLLTANSREEAEAAAWEDHNDRKHFLQTFSWFRRFLFKERKAHKNDVERCTEINRLLTIF